MKRTNVGRGNVRGRTISNADVIPPDIRHTKSMSDLSNLDDPVNDFDKPDGQDRLAQSHGTFNLLEAPTIEHCKSTSDLRTETRSNIYLTPGTSNTKSTSRSPLTKLKRLLKKAPRERNNNDNNIHRSLSDQSFVPVIKMKSSKSTSDLQSVGLDSIGHEEVVRRLRGKSISTEDEIMTSPHRKRNSLGSMFGDSMSALSHSLTLSCDILTAVVTPTEIEDNETNVWFNETTEAKADDCAGVTSFYLHVPPSPITEPQNVREVCTELSDSGSCEVPDTTSMKTTSDKHVVNDTGRRSPRIRPPPPSYPPPQLPDTLHKLV